MVRGNHRGRVRRNRTGLRETAVTEPAIETIRSNVVAEARWGAHNEPQIHYRNPGPRPVAYLGSRHHLPFTQDCSGFVTLMFKWAGAPDPNGSNFNGSASTSLMLGHCTVLRSLGSAQPGDLIIFGNSPGKHVCIVSVAGSDPTVVNFGSEGGPQELALHYLNSIDSVRRAYRVPGL